MLQVKFDATALKRQIEGIQEKIGTGARVAAQAGAEVFYKEVRMRVPVKSGNLYGSIYQKYIPELSTEGKRAVYHISWRKGYQGKAMSSFPIANHGQLLEYGWVQRYVMGKDDAGNFTGPLVRPEMRGKPKPRRNASQAVKDAYWVPLAVPIQHAPRSFLRNSYEAKKQAALDAAVAAMQKHLRT